ncbi:MAG: MBL fold metallo-hydrolase [Dehalococcoidales bacterium]|nr:MBL fold metallo-hydrolase [Dehalococcoidales bacterium]
MEVKILGAHNTESRKSRLSGVLIDGVLALDAGSLTSSLNPDEQLRLKAVLLTHRHYDHIRDIPALGMAFYLKRKNVEIFAPLDALEVLSGSILNGEVYPRFTHRPDTPTLVFKPVKPGEEFGIGRYRVLPVAMPHSVPSVGYLITVEGEGSVFYTGDTGCGFTASMAHLKPDVLIVEVTAPNQYGDQDWSTKHLTPAFLEEELKVLRQDSGTLPRLFCVHMYEALEAQIKAELSETSKRLMADITPAYEGMTFAVE